LIGLPVDVLVTQESPATLAATRATSTIPIVFIRVQDPVAQGIVASLPRPGGNVTGVAGFRAGPKGLELLRETVPGLKRIAVLLNANNPQVGTLSRDVQEAARGLGLELEAYGLHNADELDAALDIIARSRPDALWVQASFSLARDLHQIPDFAARLQLPVSCSTDAPFVRDCLMAVGSNFPSQARRAAEMVDKILKGAQPADLPVEQPTQPDVIVNVSAAQRIGLTIPASVLRQATELVR
jgi:putative ABC transport system substrate-binding protein